MFKKYLAQVNLQHNSYWFSHLNYVLLLPYLWKIFFIFTLQIPLLVHSTEVNGAYKLQ